MPDRIESYKVVQAYTAPLLERTVLEYLRNGWELLGGVAVSLNGSNPSYSLLCQAMVRRK